MPGQLTFIPILLHQRHLPVLTLESVALVQNLRTPGSLPLPVKIFLPLCPRLNLCGDLSLANQTVSLLVSPTWKPSLTMIMCITL